MVNSNESLPRLIIVRGLSCPSVLAQKLPFQCSTETCICRLKTVLFFSFKKRWNDILASKIKEVKREKRHDILLMDGFQIYSIKGHIDKEDADKYTNI